MRQPATTFADRHLGPRPEDVEAMLAALGVATLDELIEQAVPKSIRTDQPLRLPAARSEPEVLAALRTLADRNEVVTSLIGAGYNGTHTPGVILRNVLENPAWYTAYTPYQPEISQGRLEALLNFQTMVTDLTGMDLANASMLDESTAAAEAMTLIRRSTKHAANAFFVDAETHPQTIAVVATRAEPIGIEIVVGDPARPRPDARVRRPAAAPRHERGRARPLPHHRRRPRRRGPRRRGHRPARLHRAHPAGRAGRRRRGRLVAALRRAARLRRPARRVPRHAATRFGARCPAASSACRSTRPAGRPTAWRCRRASSTSAARRPRPTSAPRRCCSPSSRRCTPCTTAPRGCGPSPSACTAEPPASRMRCAGPAWRFATRPSSTRSPCACPAGPTRCSPPRWSTA